MIRAPRWRPLRALAAGAVFVALAIQLVPYGWERTNPPVTMDAPWPDERSERIARTSCYACHSNETDWPFYAYVAPFSWLVRSDVENGRDALNFSEWDRDDGEADDAAEVVADGEMPLRRYTLLHPAATLSDADADALIEALLAMDAAR